MSAVSKKLMPAFNAVFKVFNDSSFIGGFNETKEFIDKKLLSFEETFSF
jgi:hypothetical protein